jgi:hypothetical protein
MEIINIFYFVNAFILVYGFTKYKVINSILKKVFFIYLILLLCLSIGKSLQVSINNFYEPKEWDFFCFFVNGNVAHRGLDFYNSQNYKLVVNDLNTPVKIGKSYEEQELNIGFCYPPPSMFLFYPLSFFSFNTSHYIWSIFNILFLIADLFLLWLIFLKNEGYIGFLFLAALLFSMSSVRDTLYFEQTTFIVLFFLLLFWRDKNKSRGGIWLTLGIFIKPILAFQFLYQIIVRHWKSLIISLGVVVILCLVSILFFSPEIFFHYFSKKPNGQIPYLFYLEHTNQSLLSQIIKVTYNKIQSTITFFSPFFLIPAMIVFCTSMYLSYKICKINSDLVIIFLLIASLILYPITQTYYTPLVIIPIIYYLNYFLNKDYKPLLISIILSIPYLLIRMQIDFFAYLYLFIIGVYIYYIELVTSNEINKSLENH